MLITMHPFVIGELACGNIKNRKMILSLLRILPQAKTVDSDDFFGFMEKHKLCGKGLGFVDIHILASAHLTKTPIYTADRILAETAKKLALSFL